MRDLRSLILPAIPGIVARRLDKVLAEMVTGFAPTAHTHSTYQPWGVVSIDASDISGAINVAAANAVEISVDDDISLLDFTGFINGKPHEVLFTLTDSGSGGHTVSFAAAWDWFSAGSAQAAAAPTWSNDVGAKLVGVVSSSDGGATKQASFLGIVRHEPFEFWPLNVDLATTTAAQCPILKMTRDGRLERMDLAIHTAPVGASILVDLLKSSNLGSSWTTVFTNQANRPAILTTAKQGSVTAFDIPTFEAGDWFTVVIDQVGVATKGQGLSVDLTFLEA